MANKEYRNTIKKEVWIPALCEFQCVYGPCMLRVRVVDGVAVGMEPNNEENFKELSKNHGVLCPKAYGLLQKIYNPHRIKGPMKRTNPEKGLGVDPGWVEISWEEALATVSEKMKAIRKVCDVRENGTLLRQGLMDTLGLAPAF